MYYLVSIQAKNQSNSIPSEPQIVRPEDLPTFLDNVKLGYVAIVSPVILFENKD